MVARNLKLDASNDLDLSSGNLQLVSDLEAIAQDVRCRLQFFRGEWFLAPNEGVPYFASVLGKGRDPNLLQSVLRAAALEAPGVLEVTAMELDLNRATRRLSVEARFSTDLGELTLRVEI
jgi:hypothetical protein